jgi:two-component system sensor histidine kinase/response regulator
MSTPLKQGPDEHLSNLRHRLRTPLNHVIGYSDLLLEDSDLNDESARHELKVVRDNAQLILNLIQQWLAPGGELTAAEKIDRLRYEILAPLDLIIGSVGSLTQRLRGESLLDVLRINVASMDLLSFTHGNDAIGKPRLSPVKAPDFTPVIPAEIPSRILVVDDDEANCDVLSRQLLRYGHVVKCLESGKEALEELVSTPFELVLLDVMMPGMTGFEVLQQMKADAELCSIPVIMMSALDELESAAHCIQMGAEDYLLKPFDPVLLRARLHSALERKRLHQAEKERTGELEEVTRNLKRANEDLHRFAFAASHDLQEPLRTVTTTLQLLSLQFENELEAEQKQLLGMAVDASRRMSQLIADLLDYSLASSQDRVPETVEGETALEDAVTNLRQSIEDSGATVTRDALPVVLFDRAQMGQLFQNLIGNAIKYKSARRPEIHVTARRDKEQWVISVRDNGMGIPAEFRRTIFEPFRRLHGRNLPGTGLGLAICERIVDGFGGRIWVDSVPGEGSVFSFIVRAANDRETAAGTV